MGLAGNCQQYRLFITSWYSVPSMLHTPLYFHSDRRPEVAPKPSLAISPAPGIYFALSFLVFEFFYSEFSFAESKMTVLRVSALSLSKRSLAVCRPRLQFAARCTASVRPVSPPSVIRSAKQYSTAAPQTQRLAPKVERGASKLFDNADEAVADIKSGSTILSSGFGLCGVAGMVQTHLE